MKVRAILSTHPDNGRKKQRCESWALVKVSLMLVRIVFMIAAGVFYLCGDDDKGVGVITRLPRPVDLMWRIGCLGPFRIRSLVEAHKRLPFKFRPCTGFKSIVFNDIWTAMHMD